MEKLRLSDFELDVMSHFWESRELSAPDLFERIGAERGVTYSTIKTIIDRLEAKGALARAGNRGRTIFYRAAVKRDRVRKPMVRSFLRRVYGDDLRPLFAQLVRDESLSDQDMAYLKGLIDEAEKKRK